MLLQAYIRSATGFEERFRIDKNDINTGKVRCYVAKHLLNICRSSARSTDLQAQLIEKVSAQNATILTVSWEREKYWQGQLFTLSHGLHNLNKWYALNKRG